MQRYKIFLILISIFLIYFDFALIFVRKCVLLHVKIRTNEENRYHIALHAAAFR